MLESLGEYMKVIKPRASNRYAEMLCLNKIAKNVMHAMYVCIK